MAPTFSSDRQAGAFALLLLILLMLPMLIGRSLLPSREQCYSSTWWSNGAFPYIERQIFEERGDIDIAFVGPSHIWDDIDTPYVQDQLSKRLGRQAVVRSICWAGSGYDSLYFITKDLLAHRKVHLLVYYDVFTGLDVPHNEAPHLFRYGDNASDIKGLPWITQAEYYFGAVLGMPRNLLGKLRPDIPVGRFQRRRNHWEVLKNAPDIPSRLGSVAAYVGFSPDRWTKNAPYQKFELNVNSEDRQAATYAPATKTYFQFSGPPLPFLQQFFAMKFVQLASDHGAQCVLLHLPEYQSRRESKIIEREYWPEALHSNISMIGIPSGKLFEGVSDAEVKEVFQDYGHLNVNGQRAYTQLITPNLLKLF